MKKLPIFYSLLILICSLRAFQLYLSSTKELRSSWLPKKNNNNNNKNKKNLILDNKNDTIILGNQTNNIFYFIQITDLHLSRFRPKGHTLHFLHFIQSVLPIINPKFVAVTGDLTDAKDKKRVTSQQYIDEWDIYQKAIKEKVNIDWYDMRGNHDCFDLPSWKSRVNYYRTHGKSANLIERGNGIYSWQINQTSSQYQFIAIDACPKRGPSRPLNFFGYLTSKTMDQLEKALTFKPFNHTFVFSHYPTSTMVFGVSKKGKSFRDLASYYSIYFCGHLHKLIGGLGEVLKSYDPITKSLELELGDLKEHGLYRIVAVDHDLISFLDVQLPLNQIAPKASINSIGLVQPIENDKIIWPNKIIPNPSILVTNPKDARFSIPSKEPLWRIKQSSHIRFLLFSQDINNLSIKLYIDGELHPYPAEFIGDSSNPIWVVPWDPLVFDDRKPHILKIHAYHTTTSQLVSTSETHFRIDSHRLKINGGSGEFIIKSKMATLLQFISLVTIYTLLIILIIPKFFEPQEGDIKNKKRLNRLVLRIHALDQLPFKSPYIRFKKQILIWYFRFLRLPQDQPLVWNFTFFYILALLTLPWFRANFIPSAEHDVDRFGIFYMWGMVFADEWIPIADTWMLAAEQIFFDVFLLFLLTAWRGTRATDYTCISPVLRQMNEKPWFKGIELIYWLWRSSEIIALASFYGGIWPTLIQNINVFWLIFMGYSLACGKNGILVKPKRQHTIVEGCVYCSTKSRPVLDEKPLAPRDDELHYLSQTSITLTQEEEQQKVGFISSSGSSSSSTPFDGMIQVKCRKKLSKN